MRQDDEKRKRVVAAVMAGESYVSVADREKIGVATAWKWVQRDVPNPPSRHPFLSAQKRAAIKRDIKAGAMSMYRIAEKHGVHPSTVYKYRDQMPVEEANHPTPQPGRWATRCPGCGAKITTRICIVCQMREG